MLKKMKIPPTQTRKLLEEQAEIDCQSLDLAFLQWLYFHLQKFIEIVPIEYANEFFEIDGEKKSLAECINSMMLLCQRCFIEFKDNKFSDNYYKSEEEVFKLWNATRRSLYYY